MIKSLSDNVDMEFKADLNDYVGVHIDKIDDNALNLTQPNIIDSVLEELRLTESSNPARTPAAYWHSNHSLSR